MTRATPNGGRPDADLDLGLFDLDAAQARAEAELPPFRFRYRGQVFEMRNPNLVPFDWQDQMNAALEARDDKAQNALMNEQLGKDLWDKLKPLGFNGAAFQALLEAATAGGGGVGPTPQPSKRGSTRR
jgi:hypothetical protein